MDTRDLKGLMEAYSEVYAPQEVDEATAMTKRGYDEAPIRQKIAKSTGGGEAADRASTLEKKSTFGDAKRAKQRQDLARKQRGDFRNTTSSNPGLHVGQHKSDDPAVKAKQAARGAQRGALTPAEKKQLNREGIEIGEAVKGADPEMRRAASAERRAGDKPLSKKAGDANAAHMARKIRFSDKVTKAKGHIPGYTYAEELDIFDTVLEYLVAEGAADNNQEALYIMANLSEDEILEYRKLAAGLVGGMMALNMMKPGIPSPEVKRPVQEPDQVELVKQRDAATEKKDKEERERMTKEYQRLGGDATAKKYGITSDNAEYMNQYHRGRR